MRKWLLSGVVVPTVVLIGALGFSGRASASEGFEELSKLAKAGVGEEVLLAYINASPVAYDLSVDEILFFNDLGVSQKVIAAIVKHGKDLREAGLAAAQPPAAPDPAPAVAPAPPPPAVQAAPQPVIGQDPEIGQPIVDQAPVEKPIAQPDDPTVVSEPIAPAPLVTSTTVLAAPPDQANISYFYEALSPYGQWVDADGTWVWQPSVVTADAGWRPYCQRGHWIYTDAGWAWQSDYSWGWAAFHYGRWSHHDRYGWVWYPDTVWGPAWVSWRNSETHCGWAPLPPAARFETGVGFHFGGKHVAVDFNFGLRERDYVFVPAERVTETTVTTYVVPQTEVTTVYQTTTVIENPVVYRDNRVVNVGISLDFVKRKTHRDIQPVTIVDASVQVGQPVRGNVVTGATFAVYRPQIRNEAPVNPQVIAARREEAAQRAIIRQQEATARTQIRQDNLTARVQSNQDARTAQNQARNDARTQETIARQQAEAQRVQANQASSAAAAQSRANASAAAAQTRESEREQRLAADQQRQADLQRAAEQKRQATLANEQANRQAAEQKRQAEDAAAVQRKQAELAAQAERQKELEQRRAAEDAAATQRKQTELAAQADREKELEQKRAAEAAAAQQRKDAAAAGAAERAKELQARRDAEAAARARALQQQQQPQQQQPDSQQPDDDSTTQKKKKK